LQGASLKEMREMAFATSETVEDDRCSCHGNLFGWQMDLEFEDWNNDMPVSLVRYSHWSKRVFE